MYFSKTYEVIAFSHSHSKTKHFLNKFVFFFTVFVYEEIISITTKKYELKEITRVFNFTLAFSMSSKGEWFSS